ncbi:MAG: hypothetical protein LBR58_10485 [Propionibacteriaceae bacterium]|jgi:uroporphyrinogen decarboxylase|nr:hypothetical protein [Propionibacteriaceae bacterium]
MSMTARERVQTALDREPTDRPPFQATFTPEFADRLRTHFGLLAQFTEPHHRKWYGYDLELATGQDALQAGAGWVTNYYLHDAPFTDDWGIDWVVERYETPYGSGYYTNPDSHPLAGEVDLSAIRAPDPDRPGAYDHVERLVREYGSSHYIIGRVHCTIFELAWALRGFENLLVDLMAEPEAACAVLDLVAGYHTKVAVNLAQRGVDMIWLGDDWGAQTNSIVSPQTWDEFFAPRYAALIQAVRAVKPDIKIAFHTDGCVYNIIPGLIEVGVDVLNPIQTECMDPAVLKQRFGDKLSFFGGVAVQSTLPLGTPADIRKEFDWLHSTLGAGGGWLCAPTHHVQLDTPLENFLALVDCFTRTRPAPRG